MASDRLSVRLRGHRVSASSKLASQTGMNHGRARGSEQRTSFAVHACSLINSP
jgi:hypothetical protein